MVLSEGSFRRQVPGAESGAVNVFNIWFSAWDDLFKWLPAGGFRSSPHGLGVAPSVLMTWNLPFPGASDPMARQKLQSFLIPLLGHTLSSTRPHSLEGVTDPNVEMSFVFWKNCWRMCGHSLNPPHAVSTQDATVKAGYVIWETHCKIKMQNSYVGIAKHFKIVTEY